LKFKRRARNNDEINLNLTALVDVVLVLLIFFAVTSNFTRHSMLVVDLPEANGQPAAEQPKGIEVAVAADGSYGVNGRRLAARDARTLRAAIIDAGGEDTDLPFIITADGQSPHQAVVTVMDVAGALNFHKLSITTRQPED
jgi:biopolymer transport protein ExbD